jgi:transposase
MGISKKWHAISAGRRTPGEVKRLRQLFWDARKRGDLETWRRAKAVLGYLANKSVISLSRELDVTRGSINRWLQWFEAEGTEGLLPRKAPGSAPRLNDARRLELAALIDAGPQAAGFTSGMWTGPMIGDLIHKRFGVRFHNHSVPRLLNEMGFSVQRPRKRLARADAEKQALWLKVRFPALKKKPTRAEVLFSSKMRRASGSMARFTKPGRVSDSSRESTPSE